MITHVAIKYKNKIWSLPKPNRHHNVLWKIAEELKEKHIDNNEQGFLDENGKFLTRKEVFINAKNSNQIINKTYPLDTLFSEDIW